MQLHSIVRARDVQSIRGMLVNDDLSGDGQILKPLLDSLHCHYIVHRLSISINSDYPFLLPKSKGSPTAFSYGFGWCLAVGYRNREQLRHIGPCGS